MRVYFIKKEWTDEQKKELQDEFNKTTNKFPDKIPIIIDINSNVLKIEKTKYLTPQEMTLTNYLKAISKKLINLHEHDFLIYSFVNSKFTESVDIDPEITLKEAFQKYRDEQTNFLIISISRQTTYKWVKSFFF